MYTYTVAVISAPYLQMSIIKTSPGTLEETGYKERERKGCLHPGEVIKPAGDSARDSLCAQFTRVQKCHKHGEKAASDCLKGSLSPSDSSGR